MSTNETPAPVVFTPEVLRAAVMLIDHAAENGAYKGWENMQKAFWVRQNVNAFVEQWSSIFDGDTAPETTPPEEGNQ